MDDNEHRMNTVSEYGQCYKLVLTNPLFIQLNHINNDKKLFHSFVQHPIRSRFSDI